MRLLFFHATTLVLFLISSGKCFADCGDSIMVSICSSTGIYGTTTSKTVSIFDSTGLIKSRTLFYLESSIWENSSHQAWEYDSAGNLTQQIYLTANDFDGWDTSSIYFYTYNQHGDVTSNLAMNSWSGPLQNASKSTYVYDNFYNLVEHSAYMWYDSMWTNNRRYIYYPDANGNDTLKVEEFGDSLIWTNYQMTYSFYNASNQEVHDSVVAWHFTLFYWWLYQEGFASYIGTNMDSSLYVTYYLNGTINNKGYSKFQYDSLNRKVAVDYYNWNDPNWYYSYSDSTCYDSWGNIIRSIGSDGTYNWVYDSLGNLLHEDGVGPAISYSSNDYYYNGTVLISSNFVSYSQGGNITQGGCSYYYAYIEGNSFTCGSSTVELSAIPCSANHQYAWSNGATTSTITVSNPGTYSVTVTYPNGFVAVSPTFHVFASAAPQVNLGSDTTVCYNETVLLNAGAGFGYLWNDSSVLQTYLAQSSTPDSVIYAVMVTDTNGCNATDSILVVFDNCLGMDVSNESLWFTFYPNPANNLVNVSIKNNFPLSDLDLSVLDLMGREIVIYHDLINDFQFSAEQFSSGIYFLRLHDLNTNRVSIQKMVVSQN